MFVAMATYDTFNYVCINCIIKCEENTILALLGFKNRWKLSVLCHIATNCCGKVFAIMQIHYCITAGNDATCVCC